MLFERIDKAVKSAQNVDLNIEINTFEECDMVR